MDNSLTFRGPNDWGDGPHCVNSTTTDRNVLSADVKKKTLVIFLISCIMGIVLSIPLAAPLCKLGSQLRNLFGSSDTEADDIWPFDEFVVTTLRQRHPPSTTE